MSSLYADYTKEIHGRKVYENCFGFVVYEFKDDVCYIADIYVVPKHRQEGVASGFAKYVENEAKAHGAKTLLGSIIPTTNGSTESMKAMLAYGFKLQSAQPNFIWLEKKVGDGKH